MYLLDTNALIILLFNKITTAKLSGPTMTIMKTTEKLHVSIVSLWEMAIKMRLGKLSLKYSIKEIEDRCLKENVEIIPIKALHIDKMNEMPYLADHKDPFDRMIMAVALLEEMVLISTDDKLRRPEYGVNVIW